MPENKEAAEVLLMTRGQVITVADQVIDINHVAVDAAMKRLKVVGEYQCFRKAVAAFHLLLSNKPLPSSVRSQVDE
jgi:hypothetical protein